MTKAKTSPDLRGHRKSKWMIDMEANMSKMGKEISQLHRRIDRANAAMLAIIRMQGGSR